MPELISPCDYFPPSFHFHTLFCLCFLFALPQRSCERLGLGPHLHSLPSREEPPCVPSLIFSNQLPRGLTSSCGSGGKLFLFWFLSAPGECPLCVQNSALLLPALTPWRSLIGLSSKLGVWGDASVRWLTFRAGGGARWAQNSTHMLPVHPPKALPTHSLKGEGGTELNPLGAFRSNVTKTRGGSER